MVAAEVAEVFAELTQVTVADVAVGTAAGAVYTPVAETSVPAPVAGVSVYVTAVLVLFATAQVKVCVLPPPNVTDAGEMVAVIAGDRVTVAEADLVVSCTLVAVTVAVEPVVMLAGAV
jgi:hypothetical protein